MIPRRCRTISPCSWQPALTRGKKTCLTADKDTEKSGVVWAALATGYTHRRNSLRFFASSEAAAPKLRRLWKPGKVITVAGSQPRCRLSNKHGDLKMEDDEDGRTRAPVSTKLQIAALDCSCWGLSQNRSVQHLAIRLLISSFKSEIRHNRQLCACILRFNPPCGDDRFRWRSNIFSKTFKL